MANKPDELDEIEKMKRIKLIDASLYEEICAMEAKIISETNDKMMDITLVKDLILKYNTKEARRMFNNLCKKGEKPRR